MTGLYDEICAERAWSVLRRDRCPSAGYAVWADSYGVLCALVGAALRHASLRCSSTTMLTSEAPVEAQAVERHEAVARMWVAQSACQYLSVLDLSSNQV